MKNLILASVWGYQLWNYMYVFCLKDSLSSICSAHL
uniref:Uncharacterized protein n=1 Tax=Rhizophora mucronata TaxID=61149 RepID=A0A2P2MF15_RHIMU